jgi:hypothetical protein
MATAARCEAVTLCCSLGRFEKSTNANLKIGLCSHELVNSLFFFFFFFFFFFYLFFFFFFFFLLCFFFFLCFFLFLFLFCRASAPPLEPFAAAPLVGSLSVRRLGPLQRFLPAHGHPRRLRGL